MRAYPRSLSLSLSLSLSHTHTYVHSHVYACMQLTQGNRAGSELFWSTFPNLNRAMGEKYASMKVSTTEEDVNFDGIPDVIDVRMTATGVNPVTAVHSVKVLMQFSYAVGNSRVDLKMKSLGYASFASPLPGVGLYVDGKVRLPSAWTDHAQKHLPVCPG